MAKKTAERVNKSEIIRNLAAANAGLGPKDLAGIVSKQLKQAITPMYISTVLSNAKKKAANGPTTPGRRGRKPAGSGQANLLTVATFAKENGGIGAVRSALDTLDQLAAV